jgi:hypothetical protein
MVVRYTRNICLLVAACFVTVGCGGSNLPPTGTVTGVVTVDGQPIEGASVEFIPSSGRPSVGLTDASGKYELMITNDDKGALVGSHKVRITTLVNPVSSEGDGPTVEGRKEMLPAKYHDESELTAEVASGSNTIDFALTTK